MAGAFDDLNFLMGSVNRLAVLKGISNEPRTPEKLVTDLETSPVTINRILDDLEDRNWIEGRDEVYSTTVLGNVVAADALRLERTVEIAQRFKPISTYLSQSEIDFDPRLLEHATMTRGPEDSAFAHVDRWAELFRQSDQFYGITSHVTETLLDVFTEEIRTNDMEVVGVLSDDLIDRLWADPERREAAKSMIAHGADIYRDDHAEWNFAVGIYDAGRMSFVGFDESGTPRLKIESEHPDLRRWAEEKFERFRERSVLLSPSDFDS